MAGKASNVISDAMRKKLGIEYTGPPAEPRHRHHKKRKAKRKRGQVHHTHHIGQQTRKKATLVHERSLRGRGQLVHYRRKA